MFSEVYVINLSFKTDRLAQFTANYPKCLPPFKVFNAVLGDRVMCPSWWQAGNGAWGCYRSHLAILEDCYNRNIESYLVFEDDAIFRAGFDEQLTSFLQNLPHDWEQIYLGGQLLHEIQHPPKKVAEGIYFPRNVNRTHCLAIHRRGYQRIYQHLTANDWVSQNHIDHRLGYLHDTGTLRVYVPGRWMVGQDAGPSNISGNNNAAQFWPDPEKLAERNQSWDDRHIPKIFLQSPLIVAVELERRGWHRGHWQNSEYLDRGVCLAMESTDVPGGIDGWVRAVMPEAVREGKRCICLYHPKLTWEFVESLQQGFIQVETQNADDASKILEGILDTRPVVEAKSKNARNLIYHIYPKRGNGVWQWNVSELLTRIHQFNGTRTIGIVTDGNTDSAHDVKSAFEGVRIDHWIELPNDPRLGECVTFKSMLETLPRDSGITFYGHAKGVSYDNPTETRDWTSIMYEVCLDDPKHVEASMAFNPISGPFTNTQWKGDNNHGWHYSGTFFWFRNADVFAKPNWSETRDKRWGVELWPGDLFEESEAGVLFSPNCGRLYNKEMIEHIKKLMADFRNARRTNERLPSLSVVIPTLGRSTLHSVVSEIQRQLSNNDELIVVADGEESFARAESQMNQDGILTSIVDELSSYGNAQRNCGMKMATGDVIWCVDDDDQIAGNAVETIKQSLARDMCPTIFRMEHFGRLLPVTNAIEKGNVGGPMVVVPNREELPRFPVPAVEPSHSDLEWIRAVDRWKPCIYRDEVIYHVNSVGKGRLVRWEVKTECPVAIDGDDHKFPRGTLNDNTKHQPFIDACERLSMSNWSLLDLGCAGGGLVAECNEQNHLAIGIEGSDINLKTRRAEWGGPHSDSLFTADITKPFTVLDRQKQAQFGFVSAWEVLEHLPEQSISRVLENIVNHLAENGVFVCSINTTEQFGETRDVIYHRTVKPREWWVAAFNAAGMEIIDPSPFMPHEYARGSGNGTLDEDYYQHPEHGFHLTARQRKIVDA